MFSRQVNYELDKMTEKTVMKIKSLDDVRLKSIVLIIYTIPPLQHKANNLGQPLRIIVCSRLMINEKCIFDQFENYIVISLKKCLPTQKQSLLQVTSRTCYTHGNTSLL